MGVPTAPGGSQHREFPQTTSKCSSKTTPKPPGTRLARARRSFSTGLPRGFVPGLAFLSGFRRKLGKPVPTVPGEDGGATAAEGVTRLGKGFQKLRRMKASTGPKKGHEQDQEPQGIRGGRRGPELPPPATAPDLLIREKPKELGLDLKGKGWGRTWGAQSHGKSPLLQKTWND